MRSALIRKIPLLVAAALMLGLSATAADAQSIWKRAGRPRSLYADANARMVGDLLSILIQESQVIQNNEIASLEKETDLDTAIDNFDIKPNTFDPLPAIQYHSDNEFSGNAIYNKNGSFQTALTVMVIDVLPNGNMVIEGSRDIRMDRELKRIRISGIVRPQDISPTNSVSSTKVAQARISYEGSGPLTQTTNRNWLDALLSIIWPF